MDIISTVKYVRKSPRKLRVLVPLVVGASVSDVEARLSTLNIKGADLLLAVIRTAAADAVHNFKKNKDELKVKAVQVLEGSKMKRFRPVARGMAHTYYKKMSHIKVVLSTKVHLEEKKLPPQVSLPKTRTDSTVSISKEKK